MRISRAFLALTLLSLLMLSVASPAQNKSAAWKPGDKVEVKWNGTYYAATVNAVNAGKFKISYDGYGHNWDEWVTSSSIRAPGSNASSSVAPTALPAGTTGGKKGPGSVALGSYHCVFYISGQGLQTVPGFTIKPGGAYVDGHGGSGTYTYDAAKSWIFFHGGSMDGNVGLYDGKVHIYNDRRSRTVMDCDK